MSDHRPMYDQNGNDVQVVERKRIRKELEDLRRQLYNSAAMNAVRAQVPPGFTPARPPRVDEAEATEFPEHTHVWEIVEVDNNPVGVYCKICDRTMGLADGPLTPPMKAPRPQNVLDIEVGTRYLLRDGANTVAEALIQNVDVRRHFQGESTVDIRFVTRF